MGMSSALSISQSGLAAINAQLALVSQNIANASTPGYAAEVSTDENVTAAGVGIGVRSQPATAAVDQALQSSVVQQNATVSGLQTTQAALQAIDTALGAPGQGSDLGSLLGNLQNSFSTLMTDPGNQTQQNAVVASATTLAQGINTVSAAYTAQRQAAQDNLVSTVSTLNDTLANIGQISKQIIAAKGAGQSTADFQNQRNAAVQTLSGLVNIKTPEQSNGALSIFTTAGLVLPTDGASAFSISPGSTPASAYYPGGGLSGITLNGTDVTGQLAGGQIGANVTLRDATLPTDQSELDEFASGLANRFAAQGLTLFTDGGGNVPSGGGSPVQAGYVGFASTIQVNPSVSATPSLVRDGTAAVADDPAGASAFSPNPPGGPQGFTGLISRVINYTFGAQARDGVAQPALNTVGLGATGGLSAAISGDSSLGDFATGMVASQAQQSATATNDLSTETAVQTTLNAKVTAVSGVNMDTELSHMLTLQNAYSANAKVINALQSMFTQLLNAVQ